MSSIELRSLLANSIEIAFVFSTLYKSDIHYIRSIPNRRKEYPKRYLRRASINLPVFPSQGAITNFIKEKKL